VKQRTREPFSLLITLGGGGELDHVGLGAYVSPSLRP